MAKELSDTAKRNLMPQLWAESQRGALETARAIKDGWFRCQSLTTIALLVKGECFRERRLEEAFRAAATLDEINRRVSVAAWPLKVCALHGHDALRARQLEVLLADLENEPSPVRRGSAYELIVGAMLFAPRAEFRPVLDAACRAWTQPLESGKRNRRGASSLRSCLGMIAGHDADLCRSMVDRYGDPERRDELLAVIDELSEQRFGPDDIAPHL